MPSTSFLRTAAMPAQVDLWSDAPFLLAVLVAVAVGALFLVARVAMIQGTGQAEPPSPDDLTNCPDCGARTPRAEDRCEYCGEPLPED